MPTPKWQPNAELAGMVEEAKRRGLWIRSPYQDIWFSPAELEKSWEDGRFRWNNINNWELADPAENLAAIDGKIERLNDERSRFVARMRRRSA